LCQITPLPQGVLSFLSPETTALYETLLPATQEKLPGDYAPADLGTAAGSTISLYPAATRHECYRLLAVLLLFVVVRNNLGSAASLWRLAGGLVCNGVALCLFGVVRDYTSPPRRVYWAYPTRGEVVGACV